MLPVYLERGDFAKIQVIEVSSPISGKKLIEKLVIDFKIQSDHYFLKNNGLLVELDDVVYNGYVSLEPKLCGGKGGFGSMLRAIGAQIEKTTNREACRDLSGRRLRDINEEKRLKSWLEKQSKKNEEAAERKKRKLEKLCAEPKHEFKDKSYEQQRSNLTERVEDSVDVGFAAASTTAVKRAADQNFKTKPKKRKTILDLDDDFDSDDLESSEGSEDEKDILKNEKETDSSNLYTSSQSIAKCSLISNEEEKLNFITDKSKSIADHNSNR